VATFGLVHGAWHGAWCWERLLPELNRRGHRAVAVELPSERAEAGAEAYVAAVLEALAGVEEPPVLVGHSMGGLTIAQVPARRQVRSLVYLCGLVPRPGFSWREQAETALAPGFAAGAVVDADRCQAWPSPEAAAAALFADCDPETAAWAAARVRRQCYGLMRDRFEGAPAVPAAYVVARRDEVVLPDYGRRAARELLGAEAVELDTGHTPYLTHPAELAEVLVRTAHKM